MNSALPIRDRLIAATLECLSRWGFGKTTLNDIIREAGISRPTFYKHFKNKEDVVHDALLERADQYAAGVRQHLEQFSGAGERAVEALIYVLRTMPEEPALRMIDGSDYALLVNDSTMFDAATHKLTMSIVDVVLEDREVDAGERMEIGELMSRFLLSFLVLKGPEPREEAALRDLFRRRLLPALGL